MTESRWLRWARESGCTPGGTTPRRIVATAGRGPVTAPGPLDLRSLAAMAIQGYRSRRRSSGSGSKAVVAVALVAMALAACGTARPPARATPTARRRSAADALESLRGFCEAGGALTISADPRPDPIANLLQRVDATFLSVGPGQDLRWLASDLAAADRDSEARRGRAEEDDLYAALGAVADCPQAGCVRLGSAP